MRSGSWATTCAKSGLAERIRFVGDRLEPSLTLCETGRRNRSLFSTARGTSSGPSVPTLHRTRLALFIREPGIRDPGSDGVSSIQGAGIDESIADAVRGLVRNPPVRCVHRRTGPASRRGRRVHARRGGPADGRAGGVPRRGLRGRADGASAGDRQLRRAGAALGRRILAVSQPGRAQAGHGRPVSPDRIRPDARAAATRARGADRIKILEDTDGDGRADSVKVFVEGLNLASALAVGHGGVFVGQAPYLLFYPDRDHDDRPDGDPEVLLAGFGLQDAHATVNSMTWGPDGWLYGAQGSTVTARIRGYEFQQGDLALSSPRPGGSSSSPRGAATPGASTSTPTGNAFGSSNGAYITFHMVQGGYYLKGFAKHGPLHNPHAYGYFGPIAYRRDQARRPRHAGRDHLQGRRVPAVVPRHLHRRQPAVERRLLARPGARRLDLRRPARRHPDRRPRPLVPADRPPRRARCRRLRRGLVRQARRPPRPARHLGPDQRADLSRGLRRRRRKLAPFDLSKRSSAELVALRTSTNDWFPAEARRILAERRDPSIVPELKRLLTSDRDETVALRDLWALYVSGGLDDATAMELLEHPLAGVRRWTIRLLGDDHRMNRDLRTKLVALATAEPDAMVRSQLASSCQRWGADDALPILGRLVRHDEDLRDPHIPNLLWWAFERQLRQDRDAVVALLSTAEMQRTAAGPRRDPRAGGAGTGVGGFRRRLRGLCPAAGRRAGTGFGRAAPDGMEKGLEGRKLARTPAPLAEPLDADLDRGAAGAGRRADPPGRPDGQPRGDRGGGQQGSRPARRRSPTGSRMIELLGQLGRPEDLPVLIEILGPRPEPGDPARRGRGARGLLAAGDRRRRCSNAIRSASAAVRARILGLLCTPSRRGRAPCWMRSSGGRSPPRT